MNQEEIPYPARIAIMRANIDIHKGNRHAKG